MQTVYVDVLLAVNLFIDYFLLLLVTKFLHLSVRRWRLLMGALTGAGGSLVILLPPLPFAADLLVKLALSLPIVLVTFGWQGLRALLRQAFSFLLFSFALAGVLVAVWYFFAPSGLFVKNSVVYFDVPPLWLIGLTVVSYGVLRLVQRITGRGALQNLGCRIHAELGGRPCSLWARVDTGSELAEPFSGLPVVVAQSGALPPPPDTPPRLVPFASVGGKGLLRAWRAENCTLTFPGQGRAVYPVLCYIAYAPEHFDNGSWQALVPPALLEGSAEGYAPVGERKLYGEENRIAGKTETLVSGHLCCADTLHQRARNTAASAQQGGGGTGLPKH